jgi:serine/threonine protein kinase
MAPEVLNGESYDRSADVYSFALIINTIFAEALPFADENIMGKPWEFAASIRSGKRPKMPANILPECSELMIRCWEQAPAKRPSESSTFKPSHTHPLTRPFLLVTAFEQIHSYLRQV